MKIKSSNNRFNLFLNYKDATSASDYRPDIDGLRAIAVLGVLIYHLFPSLLPGGYMGVDIFFVLSGYLISSHIFNDLKRNSFSLIKFYKKRIRRILPAQILIVLCTFIAGWYLCFPLEFEQLAKHIRAAMLLSNNFQLYKEVGYFDTSATTKPLLHLWSLGLEEQFYIIFSLSCVVIAKISKRLLFPLLLLVLVLSFFLNLWEISKHHSFVFYMLPTRAWEFIIGALLGYRRVFLDQSKLQEIMQSQRISCVISVLGICGLVCAYSFFETNKSFPGWIAVIPSLSTAFLILSISSKINNNLLSHKALSWIGLISYSLYLWHWPLYSFAYLLYSGVPPIFTRLTILGTSIVLAYVTTYFFESPLRFHYKKTIPLVGIAMMSLLIMAFAVIKGKITTLSVTLSPMISKSEEAIQDWDFSIRSFKNGTQVGLPFQSFGCGNKTILFFGDSNIEQYWPRIEYLMKEDTILQEKYKVVWATYGGQIPLFDFPTCEESKEFLSNVQHFIEHEKIETVVLCAQWLSYFSIEDQEKIKKYEEALESLLKSLKNRNIKIFFILNIPISQKQDPHNLVKRSLLNTWEIAAEPDYPKKEWESQSHQMTRKLRAIAEKFNASILDPCDFLCEHNKCLILDKEGNPLYKDSCHLRSTYVRYNAKFLDQILGIS